MQSEKVQIQKEHAKLREQYKALRTAAESNALLDEAELEAHRREFEGILKRTQEIPVEI